MNKINNVNEEIKNIINLKQRKEENIWKMKYKQEKIKNV